MADAFDVYERGDCLIWVRVAPAFRGTSVVFVGQARFGMLARSRICPKFPSAFLAGADGPQEIETENSRRVAVVKINLQGVIAYGVRRLGR
jgi:hypothetical protein